MKRLITFIFGIAFLLPALPALALSTFQVVQGGTGTSSPSGILYGDNGASTALKTVTIGANCTFIAGTLNCSGGGGGAGNVATSTTETQGYVPYWTSTGATPATLGAIATGTVSGGSVISVTNGQSVIGSGLTITTTGGTFGSGNYTFPATLSVTGITNLNGLTNNGNATTTNLAITGLTGLLYSNGSTKPLSTLTVSYPLQLSGTTLSSAFGTTTTWGLGNSGIVMTGSTGIPFVQATSSAISLSITGSAGSVSNALTINNSGSGAASGSTFNGSSAVTLSYNTIGAQPTLSTPSYPIILTGTTLSSGFSTTSNTGMSQGSMYVGSGGILQTAASSSIFGYTPVPPTRNINTTAPLAGGGALSSDLTLTCNTASGSQAGCLSSADWSTFFGKIGTSSAATAGQNAYWKSDFTLGSEATGTLSGSGGVSVTAGAYTLNSGATISLSALGSAGVLGAQTAVAPTVQATSTLYGVPPAGGYVLGAVGGGIGWVATSTIAGSVANALTINNAGSGAASGSTYNGSSAVTISYNTIGAGSLAASNAWTGLNNFYGNASTSQFTATSTVYLNTNTGVTGIGTTSPYAKLSLHAMANGTILPTLFAIGSSTASATSTLLTVLNTGATTITTPSAITNAFNVVNNVGSTTLQVSTQDTAGPTLAVSTSTGAQYLGVYGNTGYTAITGVATATPTAQLTVTTASSSPAVIFQQNIAGTAYPTFFQDQYGHIFFGGPQPTLSAGSFYAKSNDTIGYILTPPGSSATLTMTFAKAWGTTSYGCDANFATSTIGNIAVATSSSGVTFTFPSVNNVLFNYQCFGTM
jgi:hypothetical protein